MIPKPPDWLNYTFAENTAAALIRGLQGVTADWGELIATAQSVTNIFDDLDRSEADVLYSEAESLPLIAAARILDSASQPLSGIVGEVTSSLALTSAAAYAMAGNFPSSAVLVRRALAAQAAVDSVPLSPALLSTLSPDILGLQLTNANGGSPEARYMEALAYYLQTGRADAADSARDRYEQCLSAAPSAFQGALLRLARIALEHVIRLSTARTLRATSTRLPDAYVERLISANIKLFLPPQFKAIVGQRLLDSTENAIVALPTSTGKTLLGELSLMAALGETPGLACYVTPWVASGRQAATSMKRHVPQRVRITEMMGGYRQPETLDPQTRQELVIATPERLDGLLRAAPNLISSLRAIVFDETHLVENAARGVRLEGILTRLRMLQDAGTKFRLLFLSAVLPRDKILAEWLRVPDENFITDSWKPTARRTAFWKQDGQLAWYVGSDPVRRPGTTNRSELGHVRVPWPDTSLRPTGNYGLAKKLRPVVFVNAAYIGDLLSEKFGGVTLFICATRADTRGVAAAAAARREIDEPLPPRLSEAIALINDEHAYLYPLADLMRRRVAYHNASVPAAIRRLIEDAAAHQDLAVVAATSTLAEGVDLPFRTTIVVDWLTWAGGVQRPMAPRMFQNILGRAGRANVFTEGDTILFDNPLGEPQYTGSQFRRSIQEDVFLSDRVPQIESAFDQNTGQEKEMEASLAYQILGSIRENPGLQDLAGDFAGHMLATRSTHAESDTSSKVRSIINRSLRSITDDVNSEAFAKAGSPLHLTLLGEAANRTGLSPDSTRSLIHWLKKTQSGDPTVVGASMLREFADLPEQTNDELRKLAKKANHKGYVKNGDLEDVLRRWLSRESRELIFSRLPTVRRSTIAVPIDEWLLGTDTPNSWEEHFDRFAEFTDHVLTEFLPWIASACGILGPTIGVANETFDWSAFSKQLERPTERSEDG